MNLVISAQTLNNVPLSQAIVGCFDIHGGTIGRSDTNTLTLPDPERHISRLQAEVSATPGGFSLRNAGANAVYINGLLLPLGDTCELINGDELRIGGYALGVVLDDSQNEDVRTITRGRAVVDGRAIIPDTAPAELVSKHPPSAALNQFVAQKQHSPPANPTDASDVYLFDDLLAPAEPSLFTAENPFDFLNSQHLNAKKAETAPSTPQQTPTPPSNAASAPRLPDDFDIFADLPSTSVPPAVAESTSNARADSLLNLVGAATNKPTSLDTSFGLTPNHNTSADPLSEFMRQSAAAPGLPTHLTPQPSVDPLDMFLPQKTAPQPVHNTASVASNHVPELASHYTPPAVVSPPQASHPEVVKVDTVQAQAAVLHVASQQHFSPEPISHVVVHDAPPSNISATTTAATTPTAAPDALWAAFCEGAGVDVTLPQGLNTEQMRMLGCVMREAVDGIVRLMQVRATTRNELRAAVTTIRPRNNNPLKFAPNVEVALAQLLQPPLRGFLPGPAAMQSAMHDLEGHSIGTMAGMRAALVGVFARFEPQRLEAQLSHKTIFDSLIPAARKAKLWDSYLQHFAAIQHDAEDDFHQLFGKAFLDAYEEQLDQLQPPVATRT
jgi:FHA domain-containing protein